MAQSPRIWIELRDKTAAPALPDLWDALEPDLGPCRFFVTHSDSRNDPDRDITAVSLPSESPRDVKSFLNSIAPDLFLVCGGEVPEALLGDVAAASIPSVFVAMSEPLFQSTLLSVPGRRSRALARFTAIEATSHDMIRALGRAGGTVALAGPIGPLTPSAKALPCDEDEREDIAGQLQGRPAWLSVSTRPQDVELLARSQHATSARSHRLLLIVSSQDGAQDAEIITAFGEQGLDVIRHSEMVDLRPEAQVVLADLPESLGLWYRLAPVTLMAASLARGGGRSPMEPAALGSAIIHGPAHYEHKDAYARLIAARATAVLDQPDTLPQVVESLIQPARAAALAAEAWNVATAGAPAIAKLANTIIRILR